jgi:hypothetical protein
MKVAAAEENAAWAPWLDASLQRPNVIVRSDVMDTQKTPFECLNHHTKQQQPNQRPSKTSRIARDDRQIE